MKICIVGLPNVGKSTFVVLTDRLQQNISHPAVLILTEAECPCQMRGSTSFARITNQQAKIPYFLNVVDIDDLTKGTHKGQGLANASLSLISACGGTFHLTCWEEEPSWRPGSWVGRDATQKGCHFL